MTSVPAYLLQLAPVTFVQLLLIITAVCLVIIAQCCGVGTTPNIKQSDISFVDTIIEKVKQSPTQRVTDEFSNDEVQQLCEAVEDMFKPQKTLIRVQPPVVIVGDIHGQFSDLLRIFTTHGHPAEQQYAFLGDYVNEGPHDLCSNRHSGRYKSTFFGLTPTTTYKMICRTTEELSILRGLGRVLLLMLFIANLII